MAVVIPQVITEDRAAAASVVTGSFSFPKRVGQQKLMYQPQSNGNQSYYTVSMWVKNTMPDAIGVNPLWSAGPVADNNNYYGIYLWSDDLVYHNANPSTTGINGTTNKLRDPNGWYHIHTKVSNTTAQCYVNGEAWGSTFSLNGGWWNNTSYRMQIGAQSINGGESGAVYSGYTYSQVYHVDGQAFEPHKFGYTDPLTGVWTPKKLTSVNDGTNFSSQVTTNGLTLNQPNELFTGSIGSAAYTDQTNGTAEIIFTPTKPIQANKIEVFGYASSQVAILNDGEATSGTMAVGSTWNTLYDSTTPTTIRKIVFQTSGSTAQASAAGIKVDGEIMIDDTSGTTWGTNGFYLPMNDDDYIGKDFSGNENHFRGDLTTTASEAAGFVLPHTTLDKATGAIPILKTDPSGQIITGGPRTHKITYKVTVVSTGEGNKYFLNGVRYSPGSLPMYRGGVYKFDQSDASNGTGGTHPLRFATAADAAGSTEYTDGVTQNGTPGTAGAYTLIVVPHNAPDTLHYYCTNHGGMGGPTANTTDIHVADPYAWKLQLAVPFAARYNTLPSNLGLVNYAQSSREDSLNPLGADIYLSNTGCQNAANEFVYYGGSRRYQGSSGHYQILNNASTALAFGTGDFTVEFWAKFDTRGGSGVSAVLTTSTTSQPAGSWLIGFDNSDNFGWCYNLPGFNFSPAGKTQNTFREWHHYAFSRESNYLKMFIDGVQVQYGFINTDYNFTGSTPKIGQRWTNSNDYSLQGELQDLRVYKGVSKYNTPNNNDGNIAFLCGSTRPNVLPEVPKGTPYPGFLKKTPSGSLQVYNDGASGAGAATLGCRLTVPHHADLNMGSGDFTIEGFLYIDDPNLGGAYHTMISKNGVTFNTDTSWYIRTQNYNGLMFGWYTGSIWTGPSVAGGGATSSVLETGWNHIAGVKHGNMSYLFVNGMKVAELDVTGQGGPQDTTENVTIGTAGTFSDATGSNACNGYISNIRIVKGTAVYTHDFEPPTENLENISGTVLLCCQSSTNVTEAAVSPTTITANGRAGASNFSPFINNLAQLRGPENNYATMMCGHVKGQDTEAVDGGLSLLPGGGSPWMNRCADMGVSSGKWYWEVYPKSDNVTPVIGAGQDGSYHLFENDIYPGQSSYGNAFGLQSNGTLRVNGTSTGGWHNTFGLNNNNNSTVSIALDMDAGKAYIAVNGFWGPLTATGTNEMVSSGTATPAATGLTGTYIPVYAVNGGNSNDRMDINFGQRPFRYTPPEGFKCLNRTNLPAPTKVARNATKNFVPYLWSGTQTGTAGALSYKDIGFQPDFIWVKQRNQAYSTGHQLYDSVRGFASDKEISSEGTAAQGAGNIEDYGWINGTYENGFITKGGSTNYDYVNKTGDTYVAWCWSAPESFSNTAGSNGADLACTGKRNVDAGFSIVSWTSDGGTGGILHGLNRMPELVLMKPLNGGSWAAQFYGSDNVWYTGNLNNSNALPTLGSSNQATATLIKNFGFGAGPMLAYCWHSVDGYCKVGNFIGNGNVDGPAIITDFKPSYVLIKGAAGGRNWMIYTTEVDPTNPTGTRLLANLGNSEGTYSSQYLDILSNGFRLRGDDADVNQGGETFFYMAFAEAPTNAGFGAVVNAR